MSSGLAFGFGSPASCISSNANATLTTFSSKDWNRMNTLYNYENDIKLKLFNTENSIMEDFQDYNNHFKYNENSAALDFAKL